MMKGLCVIAPLLVSARDPKCKAPENPGCASLSGNCCPADDGSMLGCCSETPPTPPTPPTPTPPPPTPTPAPPTPPAPPPASSGCLCVFDIDRTLSGKQASVAQCPGNLQKPGVEDSAYGGGILVLSEAAQHLEQTFCMNCYKAMVAATGGTGKPEHDILRGVLSKGTGANIIGKIDKWSGDIKNVVSPFVINWPDGKKQQAIPGIVAWYAKNAAVTIPNNQVYVFDDRATNISPFKGTGYNARQISCSSRDTSTGGVIGLCGAKATEIVNTAGVQTCPKEDEVVV